MDLEAMLETLKEKAKKDPIDWWGMVHFFETVKWFLDNREIRVGDRVQLKKPVIELGSGWVSYAEILVPESVWIVRKIEIIQRVGISLSCEHEKTGEGLFSFEEGTVEKVNV